VILTGAAVCLLTLQVKISSQTACLAAGFWRFWLAAGYSLLAVGGWLLAAGFWLLAAAGDDSRIQGLAIQGLAIQDQ
jgi:hypothetical protein